MYLVYFSHNLYDIISTVSVLSIFNYDYIR